MFAVFKTGGKQYRVEPGEQLEVELVGADIDAELEPYRSAGDGSEVTWLHQVG